MPTLLTIAELLAGEAVLSPGGPVDRLTAVSDEDSALWQWPDLSEPHTETAVAPAAEEDLVTV